MRKFAGDKLVMATHNQGKLREFSALLAPYVKNIVSAGELNLPEPEETGGSFAENAMLKARAASLASGLVVLADDSGLCVTALGLQPGIYSARWAGTNKDFYTAMMTINTQLAESPDRSAYFFCSLALAWPDGHAETVEGRVDGNLVWPPQGNRGHGYDPIFVPLGAARTFGEMEEDEKDAISHRGKAARELVRKYFA